MSIQLTIISLDFDSDEKPQTLFFEKEDVTLGSNAANDVVLAKSDIAELHATVSSHSNGNGNTLYITDHGSESGTKIENSPVLPGVETPLESNQRVTIGTYLIKLLFLADELTEAPRANEDSNGTPSSAPEVTAVAKPLPQSATPKSALEMSQPLKINIVVDGNDVIDIDFDATELFTVDGVVTHKGQPLAGVAIDGGAIGKAVADSDGKFSFSSIVDGAAYSISPKKDGYIFVCSPQTGHVGADFTMAITATELFELKGSVSHKGKALAGVAVNAGELGTTSTDQTGVFTFADVAEGSSYKLTFSKEQFKFDPPEISSVIGSAKSTHSVNAIQLFTVAGNVKHKGKPLAGVEIDGGPLGRTTTDANGRYQFHNVPEGMNYTITAKKSGFLLNEPAKGS